MGGGFCLFNKTAISFGMSYFTNNYATNGGALVIRSAPMYSFQPGNSPSRVVMLENHALRGSAIALAEITPERGLEIESTSFIKNYASIGGTLYWLYNPKNPHVIEGMNSSTVYWENNYAIFGEKFMTQPTYGYVNEIYNVSVYNADLYPSIPVYLLDFYNRTVVSDNVTLVMTSIKDSVCNGSPGFLSGATIDTANKGVVNFKNLRASCFPGGTLTVKFEIEIADGLYFQLPFPNTFLVTSYSEFIFSPCDAGQILLDGGCISCINGSYLLRFDPDVTTCNRCPSNEAEMCYADQIYLSRGFWRRTTSTGKV